ncbi:MAG TPA: hypothetical protein VEI97_16775, partial [bacterium]|nr:hypothetical protein [bacterium]
MKSVTGAVRALLALVLLTLVVSCGGGGGIDPNYPGPGLNIGELDLNIRPLSAQQGSRVIPITLQVPPTGVSQTIPARIHIGFRFNPDRSDPIRFMTAATGSLDLNHPDTVIQIPPAGREIVFFWDAAEDLGGEGGRVIIRAAILRADTTDPREAVCDFEPEVDID